MLDPHTCLECIQDGYIHNDHNRIGAACDDLLLAINNGCAIPALLEPQLSALLIMARGYAKAELIEQS